jgi:xylulokinase
MCYLLGLDIGSSSVKAAIVRQSDAAVMAVVQSPDTEMAIVSGQSGHAEQDPCLWWEHCCRAVQQVLARSGVSAAAVQAIGISYQMHGLVLVDEAGVLLRPAIIWCDSRAVEIGEKVLPTLGLDYALEHYLNAPGNFTASKLRWVQENEPHLYDRIWRVLLPGDYIAWRMTHTALTTVLGLSEGIFWDFKDNTHAERLFDCYDISMDLLPDTAPVFAYQGSLTAHAAAELGLLPNTPVTYRAGDQPNNALSLNVLQPGEVAATGGTSCVAYAVTDRLIADPEQRVNSFAHVNHHYRAPRIGLLLCINGAGSAYSWLRKNTVGSQYSYADMEKMAASTAVGSEGLRFLPFGNGAERMLGNRDRGAVIAGLQFNRHTTAHFCRAALEGVAFSFVYGMKALQALGISLSVVRAGNDNLFQSDIFSGTIATLLQCQIELRPVTGAVGAAIGAGVGAGVWEGPEEALSQVQAVKVVEPDGRSLSVLSAAYQDWAAHI